MRLSASTVRRRLVSLVGSEAIEPGVHAPVVFQRLPAWVAAAGGWRAGRSTWILLEPAQDHDTAPGPLEQAVLDIAPGRYRADTFDALHAAWIAAESAEASPLVIGVPRPGGAVILRLTPVSARVSSA